MARKPLEAPPVAPPAHDYRKDLADTLDFTLAGLAAVTLALEHGQQFAAGQAFAELKLGLQQRRQRLK